MNSRKVFFTAPPVTSLSAPPSFAFGESSFELNCNNASGCFPQTGQELLSFRGVSDSHPELLVVCDSRDSPSDVDADADVEWKADESEGSDP